jgi:phytoene dehydrogenase-like protein
MPEAIVVGAGHNGLVAATLVARAGLDTLVVERRREVGGAAVTGEICPGFRGPTLAHTLGPPSPRVVSTLSLAAYGLAIVTPEVPLFAPAPGGRGLLVFADPARTAEQLRAVAPREAERYLAFAATLAALGRAVRPLVEAPPPRWPRPEARDLRSLFQAGWRARRLGRDRTFALLRYAPMAVGDLVSEWFEDDLVRAALAARALFGTRLGPRAAGTGAGLLVAAALDPLPGGASVTARGGPGAFTRALADAARAAGAAIRTGAEVARILVRDGHARGVALASGEEIWAPVVISNADPARTFLQLVEPDALEPELLDELQHYRMRGAVAKINVALDRLPHFPALGPAVAPEQALAGRLHIGPDLDTLERAADAVKYGRLAETPWLDVTVPTLLDPTLAPPGKHVLSIVVHGAPYHLREGRWAEAKDALLGRTVRTLAEYAPDLPDLVLDAQVLTPEDLERDFALTGGDAHHGEPTLDQLFLMRPAFGWARYRTPVAGLYLCGAGTHPGGGLTGLAGYHAARVVLSDWRATRSRRRRTQTGH